MSDGRRHRGVRNASVDHPARMRDRKAALNLTYRDLGLSTGASRDYLRKILTGDRQRVGLALALDLEKALRFRRGEIFTPIPVGAVSARGEYQDTG